MIHPVLNPQQLKIIRLRSAFADCMLQGETYKLTGMYSQRVCKSTPKPDCSYNLTEMIFRKLAGTNENNSLNFVQCQQKFPAYQYFQV